VVGGTGFYLRWFTHGKAQGPKATPEAVSAVKEALREVRAGESGPVGTRKCVEPVWAHREGVCGWGGVCERLSNFAEDAPG